MTSVLVLQRHLGDMESSGERPLPAPTGLLRWGRPVLLPLSAATRVLTTQRVMALTYDDGPSPEQTPGVLDALAEYGVRATFFVLALRAEENPGLIERIVAEGHEVGLHGVDHTRLTTLSTRDAVSRIRDGRRRLETITGGAVRLFRPAYGAITIPQLLAVRAAGLDVVMWTAWARDWLDDDAEVVAQRAIDAAHPGGVLLLHDTTDDTREEDGPRPTFSRGVVTRRILTGLAGLGYSAMPVGELLAAYPVARALTAQRPWSRSRP